MFPAYKNETQKGENQEADKEFLQNPSYDTIPVSSATIAQEISSDSESSDASGNEVHEIAMKEFKKSPSPQKVEYFYEDRERKKEYLKLNELPRRAVPFYKVTRLYKRFGARKPFRRYFKSKRIKKLLKSTGRLLDEKVEKDEALRIHLIKNSQEVDKWIEYIAYKVKYFNLILCITH